MSDLGEGGALVSAGGGRGMQMLGDHLKLLGKCWLGVLEGKMHKDLWRLFEHMDIKRVCKVHFLAMPIIGSDQTSKDVQYIILCEW